MAAGKYSPTKTEKNFVWIADFQGMNQRQDPDKIPDNASPLLVNVSLEKPGTLCKRKGSALLALTQAGTAVCGLVDYVKPDGTHELRSVRSTDLDVYSEALDSWTAIDSAQFTASAKVSSVNYKGRVYHVSESDYLCYETGGACTTVGTATDRIRGNSLAVAQNTLFVAGSPDLGRDRIYYSLFDTTNNIPGDQFWNASESGLVASSRFITLGSPVKGVFSFGTIGVVCAFTESSCFTFDMRYEANNTGVAKMFDIGLANARAVCQCNGFMVWMSPDKRIWAWGGAGVPMEVSWDIEDDTHEEALINLIDDTNISSVCAGSVRNTFYFSIGDITYKGVTYSNCVIRGCTNQSFEYIMWSLDTYPSKPVNFANMTLDSKKVLLMGMSGKDDVYLMNSGVNDGTTAIQSKAMTKFFDFGMPFATKDPDWLYIKFRPQSADDTFLRVRFFVDGNWTAIVSSDPDGTTPTTDHGVIDMYQSDYALDNDRVIPVKFPRGTNFRSISIEIGNIQTGETYEVSAIGIQFNVRALDKLAESL